MKRLNPETGKPFVRGDTRADGFLFLQYYTSKRISKFGYFYEQWLSPEKWQQCTQLRKQLSKLWEVNNKEKVKAKRIRYKNNSSEKVKLSHTKYRKTNRANRNAHTAKYKAIKLQRTPPWLTQKHYIEIESVYALSKRLTEETGILHHVDHIVPLQGKLVSGLHVPWNLRAIPATENLRKSNRTFGL